MKRLIKLLRTLEKTGRSAFCRGENHWEGFKSKTEDNVLWEHVQQDHPHSDVQKDDFKMKVTGQFRSCFHRQVSEGCQISEQLELRDVASKHSNMRKRFVLNSKNQFHQPGLIRPKPSRLQYGDE